MCGFCGVIGPARRAAPERIEAMARALRHRGPDDAGSWTASFPGENGDQALAFGHARLSILDLSPLGHQPMHSADGTLTITYNGEIYNFRDLREELRRSGSSFRSECDTEVLLEAYRVWGVDAFDRLIGMFAFALWDAPRRRLVLVRDRLGIKPLYYAHDPSDGLLTFGSELHALRAHPSFDPRIDREALAHFLQNCYVTGPATIYTSVRRLQPGDYLVWQDGRISTHTYWRLTDPPDEPPPTRFEDAVARLELLLGDAVERRLIADVPLGAFLSGGIDSSAVVALMQERATHKVRTFSIGFADQGFDEAPYASAVARRLGTDHTELYVRREEAVRIAHELPDLFDEPFGDSSAIPTVALSRLTRRHVTVALSGDGGDEIFGGYTHYAKLRSLLRPFAAPRSLRRLASAMAPLVPAPSVRRGLGHLAAATPAELSESLVQYYSLAEVRAACGAVRPRDGYRAAFEGAPVADPVRKAMFADARVYLPDDILTKVDRASMSVALEARVPILDHRVVRFGLSLPREITWHGGQTKAPLRAIAAHRIGRELLERPKHGFGIPIGTLLAEELPRWTATYLAPDRLTEEGHLDPRGVERLLARARAGAGPDAAPLWNLLCFQRWFARNHRGEQVD